MSKTTMMGELNIQVMGDTSQSQQLFNARLQEFVGAKLIVTCSDGSEIQMDVNEIIGNLQGYDVETGIEVYEEDQI